MKNKIVVVGGGASGIMAAICAKEEKNEVILLEKNDRIGKKILATGNGKCNLGNQYLSADCYYCADRERLSKILKQYGTKETVSFFEQLGLMIRNKNGYLYPYCEQASAVLDVLRMELTRKKVQIQCNTQIISCTFQSRTDRFELLDSEGKSYQADRVILSCGGPASLKNGGRDGFLIAEKLGVQVTELVPGLVQLRTAEPQQKSIAGVRCQAKLSLLIDGNVVRTEQGEVQFTEYGLSGIPVFQISRIAAYGILERKKVTVSIDFMPEQTEKQLKEKIQMLCKTRKKEPMENLQTGMLHKKLNIFLLHKCGLKPGDLTETLTEKSRNELVHQYKNCKMEIIGTNPFVNAQVCAGGIPFHEVHEDLESIRQKGLYFTGELLDVDGICGGYNLHWAFASGMIAGYAAKGNRGHAESK